MPSRQPGHPPLPARFCVRPRSLSAFDCQLLTSSSSTFQCAGRLPRLPRLPRLCGGTSRGPGPGVGACPDFAGEFLRALGRLSRPEMPARSGLSTFNRVSFLSSHLSLSPRSSKSFTIRTSMTPLPQPLYNPHFQEPLVSVGNTRLITPLESALTRNSSVSLLESALTKRWGEGHPLPFARPPFFLPRYVVTCNRIQVLSFHTLSHSFGFAQNATLLFSIDSALFAQNTQGVVSIMVPSLKKNFDFPAPRYSQGRGGWGYSLREKEIVDSTES
jgi:hypothetical protein